MGADMKTCRMCEQHKPMDDFHANRRERDGRRGECRECFNAYQRERWLAREDIRQSKAIRDAEWRRNNPDRQKAIHRRHNLKRNYGMTVGQYEAMLRAQSSGCAACGSKDNGDSRFDTFAVDHDHRTGKVRGLLCSQCNFALGHVNDDPDRLMALAAYLLQHSDVLTANVEFGITGGA